jgi:ribonuclease E
MAKKLLIDATHQEEVRVAVVDGTKLDEFDSESTAKKQLKGNIYLAKVIRIEPSLQAAFVEYGGNRHGFLPFSEIHPDYYRIPVSDKEKLLEDLKTQAEEGGQDDGDEIDIPLDESTVTDETTPAAGAEGEEGDDGVSNQQALHNLRKKGIRYKIQEVLTHRQIMLVQVVKDERGNKGAALTTYLSLPGRYCVLMPNAGHRAGGVSRKISDGEDRKRLKDLLKGLDIPEGMGLIVRTAGQDRTKMEIKRDCEYLMRLWGDIRELTIQSVAPIAVYNESDLVKRAIRDVYAKEMDEILIEGDEAYKEARIFMKSLIPSHVKKIKLYKDQNVPLFYKFNVEEHVDRIMDNVVRLPSGGYIVINQTEALVAIDVNSGKSTRERNIDSTALKTNLEAAEAVAHQMRLRDLGGLVVIDFIDMSDQGHIHQVERKLKETTKLDRAKIQLGRISQFGLLELSRQRLKPSLMETHSVTCPHCLGVGVVRSTESVALRIIRALETLAVQREMKEAIISAPQGVDLYVLNQKRGVIAGIESRFGMRVYIGRDDTLTPPNFRIEVRQSDKVEVIDYGTETAPSPEAPKETGKSKGHGAAKPHKNKQNNHGHKPTREPHARPLPVEKEKKTHEPTPNQEEPAEAPIAVGETHGEDGKKSRNNRRRSRQRLYRNRRRDQGEDVTTSQGEAPTSNVVNTSPPPLPKEKAPKAKTDSTDGEGSSKTKKSKGWLRRLLDA